MNYIPYRRFKSRSVAAGTNELKEMLVYVQKDLSCRLAGTAISTELKEAVNDDRFEL